MAFPLLLLIPGIPVFLLVSFLLVLRFLARPRPARVPIAGRHVFVTGGSSGIGLAIARQAAAAGARVSILARSKPKLEEAREYLRRSTGAEVDVYSADVRDMEAVRGAIDAAGPIDVLICNQGVFTPQELAKQEVEDIKFTVDVNLMGTFHLIKAALPGMKAAASDGKPRSIAIMSSQAGQVGIYGYAAYSASKFALRGLAEALQMEVIADSIHVSLIFPPDTDTPGLAEEQKRRPEITKIIAGACDVMNTDDVAAKAIEGIKSGSFIVSCSILGYMLSIATAGSSPQRSCLMAFIEVVSIGLMRFIGLCYQWSWYEIINDYQAKQKKSSNSDGNSTKTA